MEPSSQHPVSKHDFTIRNIAAFDSRLQLYTPEYTFLLGYVLINVFLFFYSAVCEHAQWPNDLFLAWMISIARGTGFIFNFNISLQMMLASRNLLRLLRTTRLSLLLPLDQAMPNMHTIVGTTSFAAAWIHSIFHCVAGLQRSLWAPGFGKWTHAFVSGAILLVIFTVVVCTSIPVVKRTSFEVFTACHLIGVGLLLPLLIFHGLHKAHLSSYQWILAPSLIYFLDRVSIMMTTKSARVKVNIGSDCRHLVYDGGIVRLGFKKPFSYKAGQYAELCIPRISKTQWHPFTFASAPYEEKVLFFIKQKGGWTKRLYELCKFGVDRESRKRVFSFQLKIRGPYGSAAEHAAQYEKVLLISGGVGATPFCSLVKEMANDVKIRMKRNDHNANQCMVNISCSEADAYEDSNILFDKQPSGLANAGKTALPKELQAPKKNKSSNRSGVGITVRSDVPLVAWQTRAQLMYAISSTSSFNSLMLWLLMLRLFFNLMSFSFGFSDLKQQGTNILQSTGFQIGDFILGLLFFSGLCAAVVSEVISESRLFTTEVLISIPLASVPIIFGILTMVGQVMEEGDWTWYYFFIVWPMTIILFLVRYFRILGVRALLSGTVKNRDQPCISVDFIRTTRTTHEDVWLMEELSQTLGMTGFVRLHRFITTEERGDTEHDVFDHYGRPDWDDVFNKLTCNIRNGRTVGIFFCGPVEMAAAVKQAATLSMFDSRYRAMCQQNNAQHSLARSFNVRYVFRHENL